MATYLFEHIHLRCPDPEATAVWFGRMFGAEVIRSVVAGAPRVDVKLGGMDIFIAPLTPQTAAAPAHPHQGLDHIGLRVPDLDAALERCRELGYRLVDDTPRTGAGGRRIAFLHPKATAGILLELTE